MAEQEQLAGRQSAAELIGVLHDISRRSQAHASRLPRQSESLNYWEGILFSVGADRYLSPLHEIVEILNYPSSITSVPGTRPWVRGIANIRGNLLPVVDLQAFLGGAVTIPGRRSRILVVQHQEVFTGLLVGDMVGIRHLEELERAESHTLPEAVGRYVTGAFEHDGELWPVFSMHLLAASPEFLSAAV